MSPTRGFLAVLDQMFGDETGPEPAMQKNTLGGNPLYWCWDCADSSGAVASASQTCWMCGAHKTHTARPPYSPVIEKRQLRDTNYATREGSRHHAPIRCSDLGAPPARTEPRSGFAF